MVCADKWFEWYCQLTFISRHLACEDEAAALGSREGYRPLPRSDAGRRDAQQASRRTEDDRRISYTLSRYRLWLTCMISGPVPPLRDPIDHRPTDIFLLYVSHIVDTTTPCY